MALRGQLRFGTAKAVIVSRAVMIHAATLLGFSQELAATSIVVSSEAIALSEKQISRTGCKIPRTRL
jgi:hypothetical protein